MRNWIVSVVLSLYSVPAMANYWTFETPSQNIQCSVAEEADFSNLRCTIIHREGPPAQPKPSFCHSGWGHVLEMRDRGPALMNCASPEISSRGQKIVGYGTQSEFGGIKCHSSNTGLECRNRDGNGFFLSRRSQRIFDTGRNTVRVVGQPHERIQETQTRQQLQIQEKFLKILGFDPGRVDGTVDQTTISAFQEFQRANGLDVLDWLPPKHFALLAEKTEEKLMSMETPPTNFSANIPEEKPESFDTKIASTKQPNRTEATHAASEASIQTSDLIRVERDGFVYYQIRDCKFESGLAATVYDFSDSPSQVELTDICFDRKGGKLLAAEPISNLTLVRQSETSDTFEVIEPGIRDGVLANKYRAQQANKVNGFDSGAFHRHSNASHPAKRHKARGHSTYGYLFNEMTPFSGVQMGQYAINISVSDIWSARNRASGLKRGGEGPIVSDWGFASISGRSNKLKFETQDSAFVSDDIILNLEIDDDGRIDGSGRISITNPRIAGLNPTDWQYAELKLSSIIGHFVGLKGQEFRGIGFVEGQTVDQDGFVHDSYGYVNIWGRYYPEALMNERVQEQDVHANGNESEKNLQIEQSLQLLGFDPGPVDGDVDEETIVAIQAFQKQFGLPLSDVLTSEQLAVLEAMVKAKTR